MWTRWSLPLGEGMRRLLMIWQHPLLTAWWQRTKMGGYLCMMLPSLDRPNAWRPFWGVTYCWIFKEEFLFILKMLNESLTVSLCYMCAFCYSPSRIRWQTYLTGTDSLAACCVLWTLVMCAVPSGGRCWPWHQQQEQRNPVVQRYSIK